MKMCNLPKAIYKKERLNTGYQVVRVEGENQKHQLSMRLLAAQLRPVRGRQPIQTPHRKLQGCLE